MNVIDGHASLQSWHVKIILSSELPSDLVLFVENNSMSEVYKWLKNLPGDLKLEKCSKEFERRGFHTLELLKYLRPGDTDAFFPSPEKLLLAEKRILESKIKAIADPKSKRTPLRPLELSQRFDSFSEMNCYAASSYDSQMSPSNFPPLLEISLPTPCNTTESSIAGGQENKPLDRKRNEMKENLLILEVEISSASGELQKLKAE